jgi:hypothetical protein
MKLFKSLLVAPATLGLLAPMAATANEVTISDFTPAEQLAITNSRVDGLEARMNNIEAGSFSETTSASFSADFIIGAVDGSANERVTAGYSYQIDLSTSFTGEDSFDVSIDAGNETFAQLDLNGASDALTVDGIAYTFPLGDKVTAFVGSDMDGSTLYSTACVYGGVTDTLDDCGNGSSAFTGGAGTAAGASFDIGNGFTGAIGYTGDGTTGLMTNGSDDQYGAQLSYAADSFGASVTYADVQNATAGDGTFWGLNGYWTPAETGTAVPSISVGYEMGNPDTGADTTQWFVGLQWDEMGPGTLGAAVGSAGAFATNEEVMYEAFYSYSVNDSVTITPLIYIEQENGAGNADDTGVIVKTSFSF